MRASLLETVAMRRWLDGHGGYMRVRTAPPLPASKMPEYENYHPSVQSFLRVTGKLSLVCVSPDDDEGDGDSLEAGERRSVHPEEIEIHVQLPPFARKDDKPKGKHTDTYGAIWIPLDGTARGGGFFLEPKRGAIVFHSAGSTLTLVARSLEHWLLKWLSVRSIDEFVPPRRPCGARLGEMRSVLDEPTQKSTAHIPDDWEFLSFESARSGTAFAMDERDLKKIPGMLAWVRPPKRKGFLQRLFR